MVIKAMHYSELRDCLAVVAVVAVVMIQMIRMVMIQHHGDVTIQFRQRS